MMNTANDRTTPKVYPYVVGGSLPLNARSYVVRQADDAFYRALKAGQFCYVLNARQMGKSSLRVQTMARLQADGDICVFIDMTDVGTGNAETEDTWYFSLLWQIVKQVRDQSIGLEKWSKNTLRSWWKDSDGLTFVLRWREFIEEELLEKVDRSIAIFVDEIDSTLALSFSVDDFFAVIRSCYQRRVDEPKFERLTFALLGVCAPQDLIQDRRRTPFNIGESIDLSGFSYEGAIGLAEGLPGGTETLREILEWTGGQPFLTQRICRLSVNFPESTIQNLIESQIIQTWESNDEQVHFQTIQNLVMTNESIATALLGLYQRVLNEGGVQLEASSEQVALRLTGLVVKNGDRIQVANRIYKRVFSDMWAAAKLNTLRPYGDALRKWTGSDNPTWLLKGETLVNAIAWSEESGRKLPPEDYRFLRESQKLWLQKEVLEAATRIALEKQAKNTFATAFYEQSLEIQKTILSQKKIAANIHELGDTYNSQGNISDSRSLYKQVLEIEKVIGNQQNIFATLVALADAYSEQRSISSRLLDENILEMDKGISQQSNTAPTLYALANVYREQGQVQKAIDFYKQALEGYKVIGNQRDIATTLYALANVYREQGQVQKAIDFYNTSLEKDRLINNQFGIASTLYALANVYRDQGRIGEAIDLYEHSLEIQNVLANQEGIASTLYALASVYQDQGRMDEAIDLYRHSLEIQKAIGDQKGMASTLPALASVYRDQGRMDEAIDLYRHSLEIQKAIGDQQGTAASLRQLAVVYSNTGRVSESIALYEQSLEIQKAIGDQKSIAITLANLGQMIAVSQSNFDAGLEYLQKSKEILLRIGSPLVDDIIPIIEQLRKGTRP